MRHVLLLLALCLIPGCTNGKPTATAEAAVGSPKPSLSFDNIILTESDQQGQGQLWELKAKKAEYSRDGKIAVITGINGIFFAAGEKALVVQATKGQIQTEARVIVLTGQVHGRSLGRKIKFTTPELRWSPDQNRILASQGVQIFDPERGLTVTGDRMEGDLAGDRLDLVGRVKLVYAKRDLILNANEAVWWVKAGRVEAKDVTIKNRESRLTAPTLNWDMGTQLVIARQGALYQRQVPAQNLTADSVQWDQAQNQITVQGNVDYQQGSIRVQGNAAVADLKARTVEVTGSVKTSLALR